MLSRGIENLYSPITMVISVLKEISEHSCSGTLQIPQCWPFLHSILYTSS